MPRARPRMSQEVAWIMAGTVIWTVVVAMGVYWKSSSPWRLLIPVIMIGTVAVFLGVWLIAWQLQKSRGGDSFDTNGDGTVDRSELKRAIAKMIEARNNANVNAQDVGGRLNRLLADPSDSPKHN